MAKKVPGRTCPSGSPPTSVGPAPVDGSAEAPARQKQIEQYACASPAQMLSQLLEQQKLSMPQTSDWHSGSSQPMVPFDTQQSLSHLPQSDTQVSQDSSPRHNPSPQLTHWLAMHWSRLAGLLSSQSALV